LYNVKRWRKKIPCLRVNHDMSRRVTSSWSVQSSLYPRTSACAETNVILRVCDMIVLLSLSRRARRMMSSSDGLWHDCATSSVKACEGYDVILMVCDMIALLSLLRCPRRTMCYFLCQGVQGEWHPLTVCQIIYNFLCQGVQGEWRHPGGLSHNSNTHLSLLRRARRMMCSFLCQGMWREWHRPDGLAHNTATFSVKACEEKDFHPEGLWHDSLLSLSRRARRISSSWRFVTWWRYFLCQGMREEWRHPDILVHDCATSSVKACEENDVIQTSLWHDCATTSVKACEENDVIQTFWYMIALLPLSWRARRMMSSWRFVTWLRCFLC
jgi:hypothetical protein